MAADIFLKSIFLLRISISNNKNEPSTRKTGEGWQIFENIS
jgi:hypothetical protein